MVVDNNLQKTKELISFGAEIVGASVGGVIEVLFPGPGGVISGAILSPVVTKGLDVISDFAMRDLTRREKIKVGAGLVNAYEKINKYLDLGKKPRDDNFFEEKGIHRSFSDEILEGTLFKCKNEHEEKKLKYIGNIYANTAFMEYVSIYGANWLLQKSQELTFRQLCILSLVNQKENRGVSWGPKDGDPAFEMELNDIEPFLWRDHSPEAIKRYQNTGEGLSIIGLSRSGKFLNEVMGLDEIPENDLLQLKSHFRQAFE